MHYVKKKKVSRPDTARYLIYKILIISITTYVFVKLLMTHIAKQMNTISLSKVFIAIGIYLLAVIIDHICDRLSKERYIFIIFNAFKLSFIISSDIVLIFLSWYQAHDNISNIIVFLYIILSLPTIHQFAKESFSTEINYTKDFVKSIYFGKK